VAYFHKHLPGCIPLNPKYLDWAVIFRDFFDKLPEYFQCYYNAEYVDRQYPSPQILFPILDPVAKLVSDNNDISYDSHLDIYAKASIMLSSHKYGWIEKIKPLLPPVSLGYAITFHNNFHEPNGWYHWWDGKKCSKCNDNIKTGAGAGASHILWLQLLWCSYFILWVSR
jgi:hypothetical protein